MKKNLRLEEGEVYRYKDGSLRPISPEEYTYNGLTVDHLYKTYETRKKEKERDKLLRDELKSSYPFLKGEKLQTIVEYLLHSKNIDVFIIDNKHYVMRTNDEGYVTKVLQGDYVTSQTDLPTDINLGVYKIKNHKLIKDRNREEELWTL